MNKKIILFFFFHFFVNYSFSQEIIPPVKNYSPVDYNAGNHNWGISQYNERFIYPANNYGLLEFNGSTWQLYPTPNGSIIRSVKVVGTRIYTGFFMDFGYWERNDFGTLEYYSLISKLKEKIVMDDEFWNIVEFQDWVIFQSYNSVYIYNPKDDNFIILQPKNIGSKFFSTQSNIYFQDSENVLYKIEWGKEKPVFDRDYLPNEKIVGVIDHFEGEIIITESGNMFLFDEQGVVDEKHMNLGLPDVKIYSTHQLSNGNIVIGTISDGVFVMDQSGTVLFQIDRKSGLQNNTILSIFEDAEQNIWLGLDIGISSININSNFREYNDVVGKIGLVYNSAVYQGKLYLGTNQGLFYRDLEDSGDFEMIEGTEGQVWSLTEIDKTLFCGHNSGTFLVKGNKADLIFNSLGTWGVQKIEDFEDLVVQGNYSGLSVLEKKEGKWTFRNRINGFDFSGRSFLALKNRTILINHGYRGLFKLKLDESYKNITDNVLIPLVGNNSSISKFGKDLLYSSSEGIFSIDTLNNRLVKNEKFTSIFFNDQNKIVGKLLSDAKNERLWGFAQKSIVTVSQNVFAGDLASTTIPIPDFIRRNLGLRGFENIAYLNDEEYLIGASDGFCLLNLKPKEKERFLVYINKVEVITEEKENQKILLRQSKTLPFGDNNIKINFSVPQYDKYKEVLFQYKIDNSDKGWSDWDSKSEVLFYNLPPGDHEFLVRARIGEDLSENVETFEFQINKPWYGSNLAIGFYSLLMVLLVYSVHQFYKKRYNKQKQILIEENLKNLALVRLENEQELIRLKNEKLQDEVQSKTRELASSTLHVVKNNELLNKIKSQLTDVEDKAKVKPVINLINKNLGENKEWEVFKEAFNQADTDFLKKLKSKHPKLTPNDLRLCVYLRLNLSSKEIAPLLNISVQSVEIKRYRLRKKMDLEHEESLVEYILQI